MATSTSRAASGRRARILVTGATGQLGARVVKHLQRRLGSAALDGLAASTRDPAKAGALVADGIPVRQADFDRPDSVSKAFSGVETLVLVSTDGPKEDRLRQHLNAIRAAEAGGVKRIVYTSFLDVAEKSPSEFAAAHRQTEALLKASGTGLTIVRNTIYADFLPMIVGDAARVGYFQLPAGAGRATFVSRDELAEGIAAAVLAGEPRKSVYELTGPVAYDFNELARAVAEVVGRPVRYEVIDEETYVRQLESVGLPKWLAAAMGGMFRAIAGGYFERTTDDFKSLVGRPARSVRQTAQVFFSG